MLKTEAGTAVHDFLQKNPEKHVKDRRVNAALVGGSGAEFGNNGSFGDAHVAAMGLNRVIDFIAGALSSGPVKAKEKGKALFLDPSKSYKSLDELIQTETAIEDVKKSVDYVTVATPNHLHFEQVKALLENKIPVLCEKPLVFNLKQAKELMTIAKKNSVPFVAAYSYTGLPMVKLAREIVQSGKLGKIRTFDADYKQGWLADPLRKIWRTQSKKAGPSCAGGDIGTHAYEFARYVIGKSAKKVSARLSSIVPRRELDDHFEVMAEMDDGIKGNFRATQLQRGAENDSSFTVVGENGTIEWSMKDHNSLKVTMKGQPTQTFRTGHDNPYITEAIKPYVHLPSGHPEGFDRALANIHGDMARILRGEDHYHYADLNDAAAGVAFVEAAVASQEAKGGWTNVEKIPVLDHNTFKKDESQRETLTDLIGGVKEKLSNLVNRVKDLLDNNYDDAKRQPFEDFFRKYAPSDN